MSTTQSTLSFLQHEPSKGCKLLFQDDKTNSTQLWEIFDFLLWRCMQNSKYSLNTLVAWYRNLLSLGDDFNSVFCSSSHKFVCGVTICSGDPIYRCRTCQSDNNTLICVDCFKNSDHSGHDWFATFTSGSGCCDCGDPLSWDPIGFCTNHPGPSAGDNIEITKNIEYVARLLSAYIIYIISHSFNDNNSCCDVIYLSNYNQCKKSVFFKSFLRSHPQLNKNENTSVNVRNNNTNTRSVALQQLMNSPLWGFLSNNNNNEDLQNNELSDLMNVIRNESQMEIDGDADEDNKYENENEAKHFQLKLRDINAINDDFVAFKNMQKESKLHDKYLQIAMKNTAQIEEKWDVSKAIIKHVLVDCSNEECDEIVWKLRMYNSVIIAVGDEKYIGDLQKRWMEKDGEKQYNVAIKDIVSDYCRVISAPLLLRLIEEISEWCNNSEILKRCMAQSMMLNIHKLSPHYHALSPKGNLKIDTPHWEEQKDADNDIDIDIDIDCKHNEIVRESENAFYFFMLHDHVLRHRYLRSLSDLWYALITLPPIKHRVSQIFATVYELLCTTYGEVKRETRHQFMALSVQFMTINPITEICETHKLFQTVIDSYMKLTCPLFKTDMELSHNDGLQLFCGKEDGYKTHWDIACKSAATHIIFDERYLLSVDVMMEYLIFNRNGGGVDAFWKRYINQICMVQHSICCYRRYSQHIQYEQDRKVINYLRFELNMFFANQRVVLNGLYQCIAGNAKNEKYKQALDVLIDIIYYGLTLIHKTAYQEIIFDTNVASAPRANHRNDIKMKLSNFDGGYLENFAYFRTDRDKVSVVLPLSRFIMNLCALYIEITTENFGQLIEKLFVKYGAADSELNGYIRDWFDYSLRFITVFDEFHADLWIKNGDTFRTLIFNFERSDFWYIFYGAHFSLIQSFATQIISPSNLLTLILHRYRLHDWFAVNNVSLFNYSETEDIAGYNRTGWKHWSDNKRTLKMITYTLHTLIAIICEPAYGLILDDINNKILTGKYTQIIKYELIQWLVLSPTSMTELSNKIYVHNDNQTEKEEQLRPILNEIAVYHAPFSMEDTGKFALKAQYYAQFNPYFKKYDRFNPGFLQSSSDQQSDATERYLKFMASANKQNIDEVMFPNWSTQLISYANGYQLALLSAPYMGVMWNCILYHFYINDSTRYTIEHVQQCLRLISMAVEILIESKWDLQSEKGIKLMQNFTQCFNFRLTNKFDHVTDDNADELMTPKSKANHTNTTNNDSNQQQQQQDQDDGYLNSAKECKYNLIDIHQTNEGNVEGIGSVLWFLCKIFISNTQLSDLPILDIDNDNDNDTQMRDDTKTNESKLLNHIPLSQGLLIEEIVLKLYSLKIKSLMNVMRPIWPQQPDALERSFSALSDKNNDSKTPKKEFSAAAKRKKKRGKKAQAKMLKKMKKQKEKFALKHCQTISNYEMEEVLEEKQISESFGIGIDHNCIVCKSKDGQNSMFMMGFAKKCSLLHRCVDNNNDINEDNNIDNMANETYLATRKGLNFSFCGHFVHKQCYDTFIVNKVRSHYRQEYYYGRGTLSINHFEYTCPYCQTVANIVVPVTKLHRNANLSHDKFEKISFHKFAARNGVNINDINDEIATNYPRVFASLSSRTSSTAFFTKLLWIYDDYKHSSHTDRELLTDLKATNISFIYVNSVSYTISSFELLFRSYSLKQRKDKLIRKISLINTFISVAWTRTQHSAFQHLNLALLVGYSWDFIHNHVLNSRSNTDNDAECEEKVSEEIDTKFQDPFIRLICGILSHPTTFIFGDGIENSKYEKKGQSTLDFYQLILSCYIMKLTQVLLVFIINRNETELQPNYLKYNVQDWQLFITQILNNNNNLKELNKEIYEEMTPFLRKCLIVYNAFFNIKIEDLLCVLWSSNDGNDNMHKIQNECDLICDAFHIPTINNILAECWNDEYFKNYLSVVNVKYILKLTSISMLSSNKNNKLSPLSLITLPSDYNMLFQIAAEIKCKKKGTLAIKSGLCLFCGEVICIDCCENSVIEHCEHCNDGIGVMLYLQKSSIILIWNRYATQYESVFLDKYGETDCGLWRGVQLKFNKQRYNQLTQLVIQHLIPNKMTQIRKTNRDLLENRLEL